MRLLLFLALQAQQPADPRVAAREIFKELIEINTTASVGSTTAAARAMAKRLRDAGLPESDIEIVGPDAKNQNLIARLRGSSRTRKPILLLAHFDVVEAKREDWTTDPFAFVEQDGHYYGRGTQDNKAGAAMLVANLVRLRREGFVPERDIIVAITSGEETDATNGIVWVLANRRALVDAELCLNTDGGDGILKDGKFAAFTVYNATMRTTCVATMLEGGHAENALPQLARATVNCRILPQDSPDSIQRTLERVLADARIVVSRVSEPVPSPASPLRPEVTRPIEGLVARHFPGAVVIPEMARGATDGLFLRNAGIPTYGVAGLFTPMEENRAHGRDERVLISSFEKATAFWYDMVKALASDTHS